MRMIPPLKDLTLDPDTLREAHRVIDGRFGGNDVAFLCVCWMTTDPVESPDLSVIELAARVRVCLNSSAPK